MADGLLRAIRRIWQGLGLPARALVLQGLAHLSGLQRPVWTGGKLAASPDSSRLWIAGFLRSATGLGEGARLQARHERDHLAGLIDLSFLLGAPEVETDRLAGQDVLLPGDIGPDGAKAPRPGDVLVVHLNPPACLLALWLLRRVLRPEIRRIAYCAWELPEAPAFWRRSLEWFDEVHVPSSFVAAAVRGVFDGPVLVRPHQVTTPVPPEGGWPAPGFLPSAIGADSFLVVAMAQASSGLERKNPAGALDAFLEGLGGCDDAHLLLKLGPGYGPPPPAYEALLRRAAAHANVHVVEAVLGRRQLQELLARADVLLSLHRAEGFGLPMAEAMALGTPVVATGWSGNMDYMTAAAAALVGYTLAPVRGQDRAYGGKGRWAIADTGVAARQLRRLHDDPSWRRHLGLAGKKCLEDYLHSAG